MTKEEVKEKIVEMFINDSIVTIKDMNKEITDLEFFKDVELDSMSVVNLLVSLEEKFSIDIENVTKFTDSLINVDTLAEYVVNKLTE